jgi:hypothetical protein
MWFLQDMALAGRRATLNCIRPATRRWALVVAASVSAYWSGAQAQSLDATEVLAAARGALGGEKNLSSVKTFTATGRTRQIRGNNLVPIEFEINCELPDKFVRKDEIPAQDTDVTVTGFRGDELIQFPPPLAGRPGGPPPAGGGRSAEVAPSNPGRGGPPPDGRGPGGPPPESRGRGGPPVGPPQQRLISIKQDFARLMLGAFAASFPPYPLTFKYAGEGEAPEGKADVLDVAGPANFAARFVVQRENHLPVMLMWGLPTTNVIVRAPGQPMPNPLPPGSVVVDAPPPPAAAAPQEERDQYAATVANLRRQALAQAKPVEYRMYYADFRDVGGVKWPFRIRRAIAGETIEETTFDRIRINAKIDPRKFEAPK